LIRTIFLFGLLPIHQKLMMNFIYQLTYKKDRCLAQK